MGLICEFKKLLEFKKQIWLNKFNKRNFISLFYFVFINEKWSSMLFDQKSFKICFAMDKENETWVLYKFIIAL